jgi:hypothetical protein
MTLHWMFDPVTSVHTGWLHPDGPQHIYEDPLGDRYCIQIGRRVEFGVSNGTEYTVSLVRWRAAGARVGQFDSLAAAQAAAETHAATLVSA